MRKSSIHYKSSIYGTGSSRLLDDKWESVSIDNCQLSIETPAHLLSFPAQIVVLVFLILAVSITSLYAQTETSLDKTDRKMSSDDSYSLNSDGSKDQNFKSSDVDASIQQPEKRKPIVPKYKEREMPQVSGITFWNLLRWIVSLVIVIGLIYVVMYLLKKGWMQNQRPLGTQGTFNILGHMSIGPKRMLYLVEVANRVLVLGVTEAGINTLSEITDKEIVLALKNEALMYETESRFVQYLKKAASKARPTSG